MSLQPENEPEIEIPTGELPDVDRPSLSPTDDDIADGNHLGETIDVNDDADTGAKESYL